MRSADVSRMIRAVLIASGLEHFVVSAQRALERRSSGVLLENLTWVEAKDRLSADTVVVIALGAAAKEHGPHLKLATDWIMAEYFKRRVMERADVVVAPTVNYHFYPAFVNYPGSTSLKQDTARDLIIDICRTLAAHGPKRFYVLNTGVSTQIPLKAAQALLALDGILLRFTDILAVADSVVKAVSEQREGTHADEIETSMMLYIAPDSVDMTKATKDFPTGTGAWTPVKSNTGNYSASGIYGNATLATRAKGEKVVEAMIAGILKDIEELRSLRRP
jgi:creatinine amidohydrolase